MTLYEERQKMNRLNESNEVRRALYGDYRHKIKTFGIFTAENPLGNSLAPDENNRLTNQLKGILSKSHLQYVPISGMFDIGDEHSFLVICIFRLNGTASPRQRKGCPLQTGSLLLVNSGYACSFHSVQGGTPYE